MAYIVVQMARTSIDRNRVFAYRRHKGPPRTLLSVGVTATRMIEQDAQALADALSAEFPRWRWVAMPEGDF